MISRRSFLGSAAAASLSSPALVGGLVGDTPATPLALSSPDEQRSFGSDAIPSFLVGLDATWGDEEERTVDELDDQWVQSHSDWSIRDSFEIGDDLEIASIFAPASDVGLGALDLLFGSGLQSWEPVEWIDADISVSLVEPATLRRGPDVVDYDAETFRTRRNAPDSEGLAWDGVEERGIGEAWQAVNGLGHGVQHDDLDVAVIDTGVDQTEALDDGNGETRVLDTSADVTGVETETGVEAVADGDGHGTWVAECMAADHEDDALSGLLPEANVLAIKALDDDGSGSTESIVRGVEHAIEHDADVACMSLGSPLFSAALADVIERAREAGLIVVAASGNDRFGTTFVASPASSSDAIAVSACTAHEDVDEAKIAHFANCGPHDGVVDQSGGESADATPDLAAPGMELEAPNGDVLSGTSMAAPYVAAAAGLLIQDGVDTGDVPDRLRDTAAPMAGAAEHETRHGRLDVQAALDDDHSEDDQESVMDLQAETRHESLEAYSDVRGGWLTRRRLSMRRFRL